MSKSVRHRCYTAFRAALQLISSIPKDVSIKWHGDETQNEIDFVNITIAEVYAWLTSWKGSSNELLPAQSFGDMVYQACMTKKEL